MISRELWEAIKSSLLVGFAFGFFGFAIVLLSGGTSTAKILFSLFCFITTFLGALLTTLELKEVDDSLNKDE